MTQSDAEKMNSQMLNASRNIAGAMRHEGGVRVVFIGNSITIHGPVPEYGWLNLCGMAASAPDKDYVHLVTRGIEEATGRKADVRVRNLADFERHFKEYDFGEIQELVDFRPEYLVIALGENVAALETEDERLEWRRAFKSLLSRFMYGRMQPHAVVRGCFWDNEWKDAAMAHAASDFSIPFIHAALVSDSSMTAAGLFRHGGVSGHPGDKGMAEIARRILDGFFPQHSGYRAWVDGAAVAIRPIRVSAMPFNQWAPDYQRPMDQTEIAGMLRLEMSRPAEVRVQAERPFSRVRIRPLNAGLQAVVTGQDIVFRIQEPGYYVLELDGYHSPLEIFAEPERDFSRERQEATLVFGPGIHEPVVVKLQSHDRVFIDRDAVVYGSFQADNVEDVKVTGYGIISGSRNRRVANHCYREGMDGAVRIIDSRNIVFDGPVVLDSCCWCVAAFNSCDLEFSHLKVTEAWRYNTDGIDVCNSQRVHIHDCYVHSFDDTVVLKGNFPERDRQDPEEDILVERCVCWCGWGRTLEIGLETFAPYFRNISFRDCDLIHNEGAALSVHLGGPARVDSISFHDIRVECDASEMRHMLQTSRDQKPDCPAPNQGNWLSVSNSKMFSRKSMYAALGYDPSDDSNGTFDKLTIDTVTIYVDKGALIPQAGIVASDGSSFGDISINNVVIVNRNDG